MPMSNETERHAFLAVIRENPWDDDTPRLVLADWLAEQGEHDAERRLRYSVMAWQVIRGVPAEGEPPTVEQRHAARDARRRHADAEVLCRLVAVAFCRRPCVWDRLADPRSVRAVASAREYAEGLIGRGELARASELAREAARASLAARIAFLAAGADVAGLADVHGQDLAPDPADFLAFAVASQADRDADRAGELGYQARVYRALAALPPMGGT